VKSFLFTLNNPHNVAARRFALKEEEKKAAIYCSSDSGPQLLDIDICNLCNTETRNSTESFGYRCVNDTGLDGKTFFTGSSHFTVKEIEVFELTDPYLHQTEITALKAWTLVCPTRALESRAFWSFPAIFQDFREQIFNLLWRGSRDGFEAKVFHRRCDGHANTLTIILDTDGNIFGGFTPVEWESPQNAQFKADLSRKSFIFTLRNPHNVQERKFALMAEKQEEAIYCKSDSGPRFWDIEIEECCNENKNSSACSFGHSYANDTGLDSDKFFTGSLRFQVKDIEVFEITD
jgi:hypothetical protein